MEIQREAIVEIIGTQYEGCLVNHQNLNLQQSLVMEHQSENIHDHNVVVILTQDGKKLGFMPKGYASLYAPVIDSGRYNFAVEIVKTEPDPKRPILIVKITSELKNNSEEDIEKNILSFVQNIVNGYEQGITEYLKFIYTESVNINALFATLNKVRIFQKLYSCSKDIIQSHGIEQTSEKYISVTKDSLTEYIKELKDCVKDALKRIYKANSESLDIDEEEEYHRAQGEIRERRKKFRLFDELLTCYQEVIDKFTDIKFVSTNDIVETEEVNPDIVVENIAPEPQVQEIVEDNLDLSEQAFFTWLISGGDVSESTAKQYISNIHSIEKLYQTLFGVRKNLLGTNSYDNARAMIESLIVRNEYIDANERRHNSFGKTLTKFVQFADISVVGFKPPIKKKNYQPPASLVPFVIKTVDFDNPRNCTYYKPCSFILNGLKYTVRSWRELYTKFLILLYKDNTYSETMDGLVGKSLYGHRIDFADKDLSRYLRRSITVSANFFAEGNLSAVDIIKRIKHLMELCSIANDSMVIEYNTQEKNNKPIVSTDTSTDGYEQSSVPTVRKKYVTELLAPVMPEKTATNNVIEQTQPIAPVVEDEKLDDNIFINWIINTTGLDFAIAQKYYLSVKTSERIAREQGLKSQRLFDAESYKEANDTFRELLQCDAFVKMNATVHNSLTVGVKKLLLYLHAIKPNQEQMEQIPKEVSTIKDKPIIATFAPDTAKPFVLKDSVIEILSSDALEITKYREHKNGISSKSLRELLKNYYGKTIDLFEISKLLMMDKTFKSIGKGCYILNEVVISQKAETESSEPVTTETKKEEPIETSDEQVYAEEPVHMGYKATSYSEQAAYASNTASEHGLTIDSILKVIKENSGNLQYEDGFGAYEVKTLLSRNDLADVSEEEIEILMSECSELQQIEDGYYSLINNENYVVPTSESIVLMEDDPDHADIETVNDTTIHEEQQSDIDERRIALQLNGNIVRAYDYSDALSKVCEFSINCKPFRMARIAGNGILINGKNVFYRKPVPVDGYNKLSNGLQLAPINTVSDLQIITNEVKKYCQIDDNMIAIISW